MLLNRLLTTVAVAATIACPAAVLAQPAAPAASAPVATAPVATAPATPAAPAASAPAAATPPTVSAPANLPPSPNLVPNGDLVSTLKASGHFTILVKAIESTNLAATLSKTPNLTLFAPTDDAFRALPAGQLDRLMMPANAATLQKVVVYHLINAPVDSTQFRGKKGPVTTVEAQPIVLDGSNEVLMVNNADIIQADVRASNGFIHVVDKVLIPSDTPLAAAAAPAPTANPTGG